MKSFWFYMLLAVATITCGVQSSEAQSMRKVLNKTTTTKSTPPVVKGPIFGLETMGSIGFAATPGKAPVTTLKEANTHPNVYTGAVVIAGWDELEPSVNSYNWSIIDQTLSSMTTYNAKYPANPLVAKIRIYAGERTPAWVNKSVGTFTVSGNGNSATYPKWWTSTYHTYWLNFVNALAAHYNDNALVDEVAVTSCSSMSAEPMVQPMNPDQISVWKSAGYTDAQGHTCLINAITDYAAWTHVAIDYTFNPWRDIDKGVDVVNVAFTQSVMQQFRQAYGNRAVDANHGLNSTAPTDSNSIAFFDTLKSMGEPIEFQTFSPAVETDATFHNGLSVNMSEYELWDSVAAGGGANVSASLLQSWHNTMAQKTSVMHH